MSSTRAPPSPRAADSPLILDAVGWRRLRRVDPGAGAGPLRLDPRDGAGPGVQRFTAFARGRRATQERARPGLHRGDDACRVVALAGGRCRPRPVRHRPTARRPLRPPVAAPARRRGDVPHPRRRARTHVAGRRCGQRGARPRALRHAGAEHGRGGGRVPQPSWCSSTSTASRAWPLPSASARRARRRRSAVLARRRSPSTPLTHGLELRRLFGFSARLQVTAFSSARRWQSDKLVVGLVASPATLGQLGIGAQFADGGRSRCGGAALSPVHTTFAHCGSDARGGGAATLQLHRAPPDVGAPASWAARIGRRDVTRADRGVAGPRQRRGRAARRGLVLASAAGLSTGTGVATARDRAAGAGSTHGAADRRGQPRARPSRLRSPAARAAS